MIAPAPRWRVVVWPDRGTTFIEWPRGEIQARRLFAELVAANVPCALVEPTGVTRHLVTQYDEQAKVAA